MPYELKEKKAQQIAEIAKKDDPKTKKIAPGEGYHEQAEALKPPKEKPEQEKKKPTVAAKIAKKEASEKAPPTPEATTKKVVHKKDKLDDAALNEFLIAAENAFVMDDKLIKYWLTVGKEMLAKADKTQAADLNGGMTRFVQAQEQNKLPKGVSPKELKSWLATAANASKLDPVAAMNACNEGEVLLHRASKGQVKEIKAGLKELYKIAGDFG